MSLPRQVIPGADYMITRRCSERRFFLRPDDETNNAFLYCLGLAIERAQVDLLFAVAMANHYHAGIHDPLGNFPVFSEHFHALLARCQNAHLGRFESFWSCAPTSVVRLLEGEDVLDKMVYAYTNPTAADLVDTIEDWPGVCTFGTAVGTCSITATRPTFFFRSDGDLPETVTIRIARPRAYANLATQEWNALVTEHVRTREAEHRERRRKAGKKVLGREAILRQSPLASPRKPAPRFNLSPRLAAKDKWRRIEALRRCQTFIEKHRAAIRSWMAGVQDVIFPFGTYWMKKFARVVCEGPESPDDMPLDAAHLAAPA